MLAAAPRPSHHSPVGYLTYIQNTALIVEQIRDGPQRLRVRLTGGTPNGFFLCWTCATSREVTFPSFFFLSSLLLLFID